MIEMTPEEIEVKLVVAVTEYDRRESAKKGYNRYALAQYLTRIRDIVDDIRRGADPRKAVVAGFTGRLAASCLRSLKLQPYTKQDAMGGMVYRPVVADENS